MKNTNLNQYGIVLVIFLIVYGLLGYRGQAQTVTGYSLDTCQKMALDNNAKIKNASLEVQAAEQTKKAAFTKYFPAVNAMAVAFQSNRSLLDIDMDDVDLTVSFEDQQIQDYLQTLYANYGNYLPEANINAQMMNNGVLTGVTAVQPIFAGGRIVNGNKLAKVGIIAAQYKGNMAEDEVLLQTAQQYWQIISLQEKRKTILVAQNFLDSLHKDVDCAYQNGLILQTDLLKVQLKQNEMRSNQMKVENGIVLAKMALCQAIGLVYTDQFELSDSVTPPFDPMPYHTDNQVAVSQRTEYQLLELNTEAEQLKRKMVVGESLPQLAVGAGYLYNNLMGKNASNAVVFATLSVPISDWAETSHNIQKQKLNEQIAMNNREDLTQKLYLQMQQAWNKVIESYNQIAYDREDMDATAKNLKITTDYYHSGMATVSEVLESQTLYRQSCDQYSDHCIQYIIALQEYLQMTETK